MHKGLGDVAAEADVARLYSEAVETMGGIDVAVLNAGVGRHGNVEDISVEDFDLQFNTNVRGVFLWLKHILPHMKVFFISSLFPSVIAFNYLFSKQTNMSLIKSLMRFGYGGDRRGSLGR